ncbi:lysozyme inhibitor LprI family protein [Flavobacterium sp. GCM10027622]|uniref:lysozyme inhibitor LprI family protein n=1 Tax=unclassified Flavobacterium TaxID=196869 RepID=UPI00360F16A8
MKKVICLGFVCFFLLRCTKNGKEAQIKASTSETAKMYSVSRNDQIVQEVQKEVVEFAQQLDKEYLTKEEIQFAKDTFAIHLKNQKRQEYDPSTEGMNNAMLEMTEAYQKLMDKYYLLLKNAVNDTDKAALETAQKKWQDYSTSEKIFQEIMQNPQYNSGGTLQSNITLGNYFDLIKTRTEQLFSHYNSIVEKKESEE